LINSLFNFTHVILERWQKAHKILVNTGWLILDRIFNIIGGIFVGAWVARYLGPENFGLLSYVISFVALFGPISNLGLDSIVIRNIVFNPDDKNKILGTTFILKILGGLLSLVFVIVTVSLLRPGDKVSLVLVSILSLKLVFLSFDTIDLWFQSQINSQYSVISKKSAFFLIVIVKVMMVFLKAPLIAFILATLLETIFGALGLLIVYQYRERDINSWKVNLKLSKQLLRNSWPLIFSGLAIMIYMKIDKIMLGQMIGNNAVGIYSVATRISEVWYFIPMAIAASVFPAIIRSRKKGNEALYEKKMQTLYDILTLLSYLTAISLAILASPIIRILFGAAYTQSIPILKIHIWAFIFISLGVARGKWLITEELMKIAMLFTVMGAIANVGLNYALIPKYGGLGAAWATFISYLIASYLSGILTKRVWPAFKQQTLALLIPFRIKSFSRELHEVLK